MDALIEIGKNDLPKLRDLLRINWPYGVEGHCLLNTQLSCPSLTEKYNFKFYSPGGGVSHGMVAVSDKKYNYEVFICPANPIGLDAIENALSQTKVIDWNREVTVLSVNLEILNFLKRLSDQLGLKLKYENDIVKYKSRICKHLRSKDDPPFDISNPPENTYVGPWKDEHLDLINRKWPFYHGQHSYDNLKTLMLNGSTYALYSSKDHAPISWIAVDYAGVITCIYPGRKH